MAIFQMKPQLSLFIAVQSVEILLKEFFEKFTVS